MSEDPVMVAAQDGILELVLNRPAKLNAITGPMAAIIAEQAERFAVDDSLRVMLIRAKGKYFSAGVDFSGTLMPDANIATARDFRRWYRESGGSLHPLFDRFEAIEKPIVAAHHAPCLGGAMEMSLSCDFRLASESASYALPETGFGNIPGSGGISRLTRLVGVQWAKWFVMANLPMGAAKAAAIGLVHEVFADDVFEDRVREFCRHLAAQPPEVVGTAKLAIELAADLERAQARNVERLTASTLYLGEEFQTRLAVMKAKFGAKNKE